MSERLLVTFPFLEKYVGVRPSGGRTDGGPNAGVSVTGPGHIATVRPLCRPGHPASQRSCFP